MPTEGIPTGTQAASAAKAPEIHIFGAATPAMIKHCWLVGPIFAQAALAFAEMLESNNIDQTIIVNVKKPTASGPVGVALEVQLVQCPADEKMGGLPGEMRLRVIGGKIISTPQTGIDEPPVDLTEGPKVATTQVHLEEGQ